MGMFTKIIMRIWLAFVILATILTTSYAAGDLSAVLKLIAINPAYFLPHGMLWFGF
jgi:hypothetical protein